MIITTNVSRLRDCGGPRLADTPTSDHARAAFLRERTAAANDVPSTGEVRPQAGIAAIAHMTLDVKQGKALARVQRRRSPA